MTSEQITRRQWLSRGLGFLGATGILSQLEPSVRSQIKKVSRSMKIAKIDRTTVKLSYRPAPARNMARELPHWIWSEIFQVTLRSGHVGYGETLLYYTWQATTDEDVRNARNKNAVELMWDDDALGAGLQMALFDAVARAMEVPVYALFGKKVNKKTPLAWWNIDTTIEDMVSECKEAHKKGYTSYKTKGRPWFDVWKQNEEVSKALPKSFKLAIDFNDTLLTAKRGIPILKDLAKLPQMHIYETPIFQTDVKGNQAIRKATPVPVAHHYGRPAPVIAVKQEICDGFVVGKGAKKVMQAGAVAAMADMPFWLQLVGSGVTAAFSMQFGAVLSHAKWPAVNCHQLYEHDLLAEPIVVKNGYADVSDKVGLGRAIDWNVVKKLAVEKPKRRPDPPRLMETSWPDGRKMYVANDGKVNFFLTIGQKGAMPYFERGVDTRIVPDDGSADWKLLYQQARRGPVMKKS